MTRKIKSIIAIVLALAVLCSGFTFAKIISTPAAKADFKSLDEADKVIVDQIVNTTGAKKENVIKLRQQGKEWNEIMDITKSGDYEYNNIDTRDYRKLLESENQEDVKNVKMAVDRIVYGLNEIYAKKEIVEKVVPEVKTDVINDKDDIEEFYKLKELFEIDKATYLCIKLKEKFDTYEGVLDEYLYSLQIDVDLMLLLDNKDEYDNQMADKGVFKNRIDAINASKIELKMLELTKSKNEDKDIKNEQKTEQDIIKENNNINNSPAVVPDVKPKKPEDEIMKEIEEIKKKGRE